MNTSCYSGVKLLEYCMKIVESVFKKRLHQIVIVNENLFRFYI